MCGIAGWLTASGAGTEELEAAVRRMTAVLVHRGPDDGGFWVDGSAGVALGHRRLSILDLSPAGHQPMHSVCGRYTIVFNGEVYNYRALRAELDAAGAAARWRGRSDTEVVLAAVAHWGLPGTLARTVGMFAFGLWDAETRSLCLARDRLGEKPLYYGWVGGGIVFASELKAFRAHPAWQGEPNRDALALYLRHAYVPAPYSAYRDVFKLPAGTWLRVDVAGARACPWPDGVPPTPPSEAPGLVLAPYWSARKAAERVLTEPFSGDEGEAAEEVERVLAEAVSLQMVADVPVGAFLSGGVDSSLVVALMQAQSAHPVRTFTIGFREETYNEAEHARAVARHLGTDHTDLYVAPSEAMAVIPSMPDIYDEPFADSSQLPTLLVSRLARSAVKVSLSGDGGDELFGGYYRYAWGQRLWTGLGWVPRPLRAGLGRLVRSVPPHAWDRLYASVRALIPQRLAASNPGDKLHKLAEILGVEGPDALYYGLVSLWRSPEQVMRPGGREPPTVLTRPAEWPGLPDFSLRMAYLDLLSYLPDDLLVKLDRAAMSVSLESRVPLLDHRVVELALRMPVGLRMRHGQGKWLLRRVLYRYVPPALVERPKMGFGVPIGEWLRGPLRDWAESLLARNRLEAGGLLHPVPIRAYWEEHLAGRRNWAYRLWTVLMLQAWTDGQRLSHGQGQQSLN